MANQSPDSMRMILLLLGVAGAAGVAYYSGRRTGLREGDEQLEEFARQIDADAEQRDQTPSVAERANALIGGLVQLTERAKAG